MADRTASVGGNWATAATWGGAAAPTGSQTWEIANGVDVILAADPGALTGAGEILAGGRLTVACVMTGTFGNIVVNGVHGLYSSRSVSNYLRVAGTITSNVEHGIDYGISTDPCSDAAIGHGIEIVCTSDAQASRGIILGIDNAITVYGAATDNESTLAAQELAATNNTHIVLTDDMALRAGTLAQVQQGIADLICVCQNPTLGVGVGAQNYQIDIYRVSVYTAGTKTVDLEDAAAGQTYWPRGGTSGGSYKDIDVQREIGCDVRRLGSNVVFSGTAYNLRPAYMIDFGATAKAATIKNCMFMWANGSTSYGAIYRAGSNLTIENVHFTGNSYGWSTCNSCVNSGSGNFTGNSHGWDSCNSCVNSGSGNFTGNSYGWYLCNSCVNSGSGNFTGNSYGWYSCNSCVNSGSGNFTGNSSGWYLCNSCVNSGSGNFTGNSYGWSTCNSCTNGGTGDFSSNTYDIRRDRFGRLYHTAMGATVENYEYNTYYNPFNNYVESIDHDGSSGAYKAWGRNCVVIKDVATYPSGKTHSYKTAMEAIVGEAVQRPSFYQTEYTIPAGRTLTLDVWLKKDANSMTVIPSAMIIDPGLDPLLTSSHTPLDSFTMADNTDWQTDTLVYTNTKAVPMKVVIRAIATNASSNFYFYYEIISGSGGSAMLDGGFQ